MTRPKLFDRATALNTAMEVFWEKGYEATSVRDLIGAMGIQQGSLYSTFGSKRELFVEALDRYCEENDNRIFRCVIDPHLAATLTAHEKVHTIFDGLIDEAADVTRPWGCLLVNSSLELNPADPAVAAKARATVEKIEHTFVQLLEQAMIEGDFGARGDSIDVARALTTTVLGVRVLAKMHPDRRFATAAVRATLELVA